MASSLARKYAQAVLKILDDAGSMNRVELDLENTQKILTGLPSLARILANPGVDAARKSQLIDELMGKLDAHPVAVGAIALLSEQRMIAILPEVISVYRRLRDERLGVTSVTVISARAIDSADHGAWESTLSKVAGTPVRIDYGTDPSLIGGAVAIDPLNNVFVTGGSRSLQIFDRTASGHTKPLRVIGGPKNGDKIRGSKNITLT